MCAKVGVGTDDDDAFHTEYFHLVLFLLSYCFMFLISFLISFACF